MKRIYDVKSYVYHGIFILSFDSEYMYVYTAYNVYKYNTIFNNTFFQMTSNKNAGSLCYSFFLSYHSTLIHSSCSAAFNQHKYKKKT